MHDACHRKCKRLRAKRQSNCMHNKCLSVVTGVTKACLMRLEHRLNHVWAQLPTRPGCHAPRCRHRQQAMSLQPCGTQACPLPGLQGRPARGPQAWLAKEFARQTAHACILCAKLKERMLYCALSSVCPSGANPPCMSFTASDPSFIPRRAHKYRSDQQHV